MSIADLASLELLSNFMEGDGGRALEYRESHCLTMLALKKDNREIYIIMY